MGVFSSKSSLVTAEMSGPVAEFVKKTIAGSKVVIFSKTYCPYCDMAKEVISRIPGPSDYNFNHFTIKLRDIHLIICVTHIG